MGTRFTSSSYLSFNDRFTEENPQIDSLTAGARYEPLQMILEPPERFLAGLRFVA